MNIKQSRKYIQDELYNLELCQNGINTLTDALHVLEEEENIIKVSFNVYTKTGKDCSLELTKKSATECINVLIEEYYNGIRQTKSEINKIINSILMEGERK